MSRHFARIVLAVAAVGMAGGLVTGCGDDDATATSTPTSESAAASSSAAPGSTAPGQSASVTTSPGTAATAPPETPQPAPPGFPGGTEPPAANEKDGALIAELEANGVATSPEVATAVASYICRAIADGSTPDEMNTFVIAMVGSDPESTQLSPEDAATVYIDAAKKTYC